MPETSGGGFPVSVFGSPVSLKRPENLFFALSDRLGKAVL